MRWPQNSAVTRRDEQLARTRRLTLWVAGGATAASFSLAAALGFALPGHTSTAAAQPAGQPGTQSGSGRSSQGGTSGTRTGSGHRGATGHRRLAPPHRPPAKTSAPPVVSSGGS